MSEPVIERLSWQTVPKWPAVVSVALTVVLGVLIALNVMQFDKQTLERAAEVVLLQTFLVAAGRYWLERHAIWGWGMGMAVILFCRELHFVGTSIGVYLGFGLLMLWFARRYPEWSKDYRLRPSLGFLVAALSTYAVSFTIDQRWWRGMPFEAEIHTRLEETLEVCAHSMVGLAVATLSRRRK